MSLRDVSAISGVVLLLAIPLCQGKVLFGSDIISYLIMAQQTAANLADGILLPAWAVDLNNGFGGPALLFYPPLLNVLHALSLLIRVPLVVGVTVLAVLAWALSGVTMLAWLRSKGAPNPLFGSIVYLVAPYRAFDVYDRGALSEHWSFVWVPLILWSATDARFRWQTRTSLVAAGTAALILSSVPFALLFGMVLTAWLIWDPDLVGRRSQVAFGALLGALVSSFALIPQALTSRWVMTELFFGADSSRFRPSSNTIFLPGSMWISSIVCVTAGLLLVSSCFALQEHTRADRVSIWAATGMLAFVVTLPWAGPLWDVAPIFSKIQFPWRTAGPLTLCTAAVVGWSPRRLPASLTVLLALLATLPQLGRMTVPVWRFPLQRSAVSAGIAFPDPRAVSEASGVADLYYDPVLEDARIFGPDVRRSSLQRFLLEMWFIPRGLTAITRAAMAGVFRPPLEVLEGRPGILVGDPARPVLPIVWGRLHRTVSVDAARAGRFWWRIAAFPGMETELDGRPVPSFQDSDTGLLAVDVPPGRHRLSWRWRPPRSLRIARWISGAAAMAMVGLVLFGRREKLPGPIRPRRAKALE